MGTHTLPVFGCTQKGAYVHLCAEWCKRGEVEQLFEDASRVVVLLVKQRAHSAAQPIVLARIPMLPCEQPQPMQ